MSRVRNADEFSVRLSRLRADYDKRFRLLVEKLRVELGADLVATTSGANQLLEAHARRYFIDGLFEALNWNITSRDGAPNLFVEAPIESDADGTTKFLDYFGVQGDTRQPLVVIEAKRPSLELPRRRVNGRGTHEAFEETICAALNGEEIHGGWTKRLGVRVQDIGNTFGLAQ